MIEEAKLFLKYPTKEISFEDDDVLYGTHEGGEGTQWLNEFTKAWKKEINIPFEKNLTVAIIENSQTSRLLSLN